jgi:amidohydrolase
MVGHSVSGYADYLSGSSLITEDVFRQAIADRKALHLMPELGFELPRTREYLASSLGEIGFAIDSKAYGKSGLAAWIDGGQEGPTTMLRADMDALPIEETNERAWRSSIEGRSHACGHDGHMAIALGVARTVARHRERLAGRLLLCLQPSEEPGGGAKAMIADGLLELYRPQACYGVHVWSELDTGVLAVREGALFASCDKLSWIIRGKGGHGAMPHLTRDTVSALGDIISSNSALVAREIDAQEASVISLGNISTASAHNIVPSTIECHGTLRTQSVGTRKQILNRLSAMANAISAKFEVEIDFQASGYIPPCISDPIAVNRVTSSAKSGLSEKCRIVSNYGTMAGEDMAEFLSLVPGCYFLVGCRNAEKGIVAPHHTSEFDIDEDAMAIAMSTLSDIALAAI